MLTACVFGNRIIYWDFSKPFDVVHACVCACVCLRGVVRVVQDVLLASNSRPFFLVLVLTIGNPAYSVSRKGIHQTASK